MGKKLTIQDIQLYLNEMDIEHNCLLVSTEYKNSTTPLIFICNSCGKTFERDWAHLKRGRFLCTACSNKHGSPFTIETVRNFLNKNDINHECTLLSSEYVNNSTPLHFRCNLCGEEFDRDYQHLIRDGGRFRCPQCGINAGAKAKKYNVSDIDKILAEKGYTRTGDYVNAATPFSAICSRGHNVKISFTNFLCKHSGCKKCAILNQTGELSPLWKGGVSEVMEELRKTLKPWKAQILARDGYKCQLSGEHKDLEVHHLKGFNTLVREASEITSVPILVKINDYSNIEDFYTLREKVLELHTLDIGITLTKSIHKEFHAKFGKGDNTKEQFEAFCLNR